MKWILSMILVASLARADEVLPSPEETHARFQPNDDGVVAREYEYKKRYTSEAERNAALQEQITKAREGLASKMAANPNAVLHGQLNLTGKSRSKARNLSLHLEPFKEPERVSLAKSFLLTGATATKSILPTGSFVKAKVMSGVEAGQDPLPMLLALDFAFTGPNHTEINLKHCHMIAKAKGNISNERVYGETTKISCVREDGEYIEREAHGYIVGEDATFGAIGPVVSKKGQAIAAAASLSAMKGIGEAVGLTESTSQTFSTGNVIEKTANITGSKAAVIVGKAGMEAASLLAQEAIEQARSFQPSVAIGSGRNVWVVMLEAVDIPMLKQNTESED